MGWLSNYADRELEVLYRQQLRRHRLLIAAVAIFIGATVSAIICAVMMLPWKMEKKLEMKEDAVKILLEMERGYTQKIKPLGPCVYDGSVYDGLFGYSPSSSRTVR